MTPSEIDEFVAAHRVATLATLGPTGMPHLTAMWFGVLPTGPDGAAEVWFETKAKSQKAVNLRRDSRVSVLVEDGDTYDTLRGVAIEGRGEVSDDPDVMFPVGVSVYERYHGPYTPEMRDAVTAMLSKRVVVRVVPQRTRSWDHRKLGLPAMPVAGSTAG
ncbi:hypothetical protein Rrhod_2445 [Rhodococcus rhodnii LMG 5362]|uniref:Pyridoxamine 5'-phosphate oxidase N-terminal domain-containing protein n=2 Tax=Rhodococcus rhodnii TaxID=38312 RepID=R7WLR4_9NOCA|nr:hypothetical protein Rrhod_2445 [Rhodococcus rhodnii LMG 5362]